MNEEAPASPRGSADDGGDPACWSHRVCPDCGRLADSEPPTTCLGCGRDLAPAPSPS